MGREGDEAIKQYTELRTQLAAVQAEIQGFVLQPQYSMQFLRAGRIVSIRDGAVSGTGGVLWGYAVGKGAQPLMSMVHRIIWCAVFMRTFLCCVVLC